MNPQAESNFSDTLEDILKPLQLSSMNAKEIIAKTHDQNFFYARLNHEFQQMYIDNLRCYHRNKFFNHDSTTGLRLGDVVLVKPTGHIKLGSKLSRINWQLARITKIYYGQRDGIPRAADYEIIDNQSNRYPRASQPLQNFAPLELWRLDDPKPLTKS